MGGERPGRHWGGGLGAPLRAVLGDLFLSSIIHGLDFTDGGGGVVSYKIQRSLPVGIWAESKVPNSALSLGTIASALCRATS